MSKLSQRERLLLLLAAGFLALMALGWGAQWLAQGSSRRHRELQSARRNVKLLQKLKGDIDSMAAFGGSLPDQTRLVTMATTAIQNQKLNATSVRDHAEKVDRNDQKISVEMSFNGIPLDPVFKLLHELEYGQGGLSVGELTIRRALSGRDVYDVHITVYVIAPGKAPTERE